MQMLHLLEVRRKHLRGLKSLLRNAKHRLIKKEAMIAVAYMVQISLAKSLHG